MEGMFNNDDFSWNSNTIFDKIGNQEKREEYLTELSGTGNNEKEMIAQLRSLNEDEMKTLLYQLPQEDKDEFLNDYYGLPKIDTQNVSPSPEIAVEGPETAPSYGMMEPLELNASVNF
tara:strand:+ start:3685 stop:4038 length:354 start_codon:yes stop_codon:yes gene_type:complete